MADKPFVDDGAQMGQPVDQQPLLQQPMMQQPVMQQPMEGQQPMM